MSRRFLSGLLLAEVLALAYTCFVLMTEDG